MKRYLSFLLLLSGVFFMNDSVKAQSLSDILNSSAVKSAVTSLTGGKELSAANLTGTWKYTKPAIQLKSDDALKNVAGNLATSELEKKMQESCAKVGIVEGAFSYTFNADSTFSCTLKGKSFSGTYSLNSEAKTINLKFGAGGKLSLLRMSGHVVLTDDTLSLLFNADKVLDFINKLSSISNNATLKTVASLAKQYDGVMLGFELKK